MSMVVPNSLLTAFGWVRCSWDDPFPATQEKRIE